MLMALIKKEYLLLARDMHGLLLLFIMPLMFVLIMSLALKDAFSQQAGALIDVAFYDALKNEDSRLLLEKIGGKNAFSLLAVENIEKLNDYDLGFELTTADFSFSNIETPLLTIHAKPEMKPMVIALLSSVLSEARMKFQMEKLRLLSSNDEEAVVVKTLLSHLAYIQPPEVRYQNFDKAKDIITPNSVQQNVPAWLVFGMFFIVVPLSATWLSEQQSGTLKRLQTMNVSAGIMVLGKLLPYFVINLVQAALMLSIGVFLLPLFGADALSIGGSKLALLIVTISSSIAALGYALFIASIVKTTEQAAALGGVGNVLLAAIGGVMVPVFVMPSFMQELAVVSPMYWSVQAFLDVLLKNGGVSDILFESGCLILLGCVLLLLATKILSRQRY